jgi:diacylglycerol kinase (ATP)
MATLPAWVQGQARYVAGSLLGLADLRPFDVAWAVDGEPQPPARALFVAVGNARYFGAGMHVLPQAVPDDGLLDAVLVEERPVWELLPSFPRLFAGTHLEAGFCRAARGRVITLEADAPVEVDGEIAGHGPVTVTVVPGALRLVV